MTNIALTPLFDENYLSLPADVLATPAHHDMATLSSPMALFNLPTSSPTPVPWLSSADLTLPLSSISPPAVPMSSSNDLTTMLQSLFPDALSPAIPTQHHTSSTLATSTTPASTTPASTAPTSTAPDSFAADSTVADSTVADSTVATSTLHSLSTPPSLYKKKQQNGESIAMTDNSNMESMELSTNPSTTCSPPTLIASDHSDSSSASASLPTNNISPCKPKPSATCQPSLNQQKEQECEIPLMKTNLKAKADKADERRRKNRESSSKCYYKRKQIVDALNADINKAKQRITELNNRALELRHENARLKRQVVTSGLHLPISKHDSFNHRPETTLHLRDYLLFLAFQGSTTSVPPAS